MAPPSEPNPAPGAEGQPGRAISAGGLSGSPIAASHQQGSRPLRRDAAMREQPGWLVWLPVGLSSLLLVLFGVVVNRQQLQAERISELLGRVQALEHSRTLERTAVLEQQLRSMLGRLQDIEKKEQRQEQLARGLQTLEQELQQLRATARPLSLEPLEPPAAAPVESSRPNRPRPVTPLTP